MMGWHYWWSTVCEVCSITKVWGILLHETVVVRSGQNQWRSWVICPCIIFYHKCVQIHSAWCTQIRVRIHNGQSNSLKSEIITVNISLFLYRIDPYYWRWCVNYTFLDFNCCAWILNTTFSSEFEVISWCWRELDWYFLH